MSMKRVLSYVPGIGLLIVGLGLYFLCGFGCLLLPLGFFDFEDHCMDNDLLYSIRSDGKSIIQENAFLGPNYSQNTRGGHLSSVSQATKVEKLQLASGLYMLNISRNGESSRVQDTSFDYEYISEQGHVYYLESKSNSTVNQSWIGEWQPKKGFQKLADVSGEVTSLSMSLDSQFLVATYYARPKGKAKVLTVSLRDKVVNVLDFPDWALHPLMLVEGEFMVRKHISGNYGQVVRWSPELTNPNNSSNDLYIYDSPVIDIAGLNGHIWGILLKNGHPSVVRLDKSLQKVEENIGWMEFKGKS